MDLNHILIAGAQKCGTSTLHATLLKHPDIQGASDPQEKRPVKEPHYFDLNWYKGFGWYASHFKDSLKRSIDATPNYISDRNHVARMHRVFPHARIIISLRDPVERAISAHNHYTQDLPVSEEWDWRKPGGSLEENIRGEWSKPYPDFHGFLRRGLYIDHLQHLLTLYPREQLHVVIMEEWVTNPEPALKQIYDFLDLPQVSQALSIVTQHRREHTVPAPSLTIRQELIDFYRASNERLYAWLGREIPQWQK